jgi:protein TonB
LSGAVLEYRACSNRERATAVAVIASAHLFAAAALVSLSGIIEVIQQVRPMMVQMVPATTAQAAELPRTIPPPKLRVPEVVLPNPPPVDNLYTVRMEERTAPPAPALVSAVISTAAAPPSLEPPRFDLAYLNNPAPAYPPLSRKTGEQGRVLLRVRVDSSGQVEGVEIHRTSGFARLDEAAIAAVRRWRFVPARAGERAIGGIALVPVAFELRS